MKCKKVLCAFTMLLTGTIMSSVCFYGCDSSSLNDDTTTKLPSLSELEDVDDVCTKMKDINFMAYCYDNFDVNHDGKVSMTEAAAVNSISCSTATDFTGIEYFTNLKSFTSTSVETIDLRHNTELASIEFKGSPIKEMDLSYNINITSLSGDAFCECTSLTHIVLPESLTYIGGDTERSSAFRGCTSLSHIDLPSALIYIGEDVFRGCTSLTYIDLPLSLIGIGEHAFYMCSSLNTVLSNAITPPTIWYSFEGIDDSAILYVPSESVEAYKDSDWAQYFDQILAL